MLGDILLTPTCLLAACHVVLDVHIDNNAVEGALSAST